MATKKTSGAKKPARKPARARDTIELAKELAVAVIREHGLPDEVIERLKEAGVPQEVIERLGGGPYAPYGGRSGVKKRRKAR